MILAEMFSIEMWFSLAVIGCVGWAGVVGHMGNWWTIPRFRAKK